uniref:AlNc14C1007G12711 protein n=1 Tax=Albugo laibachii Nc14 TaxID=890382 RepID=F0X2F0_9STRA|nr:AlNc14C1007G12711 [Albugo laibachii Nc14]|eukprot:CCA28040.1 AlNc14C1007G12711 [Albugo laibachii Nc14]
MGLDDLLPGKNKRARATALNAFLRFIQSEDGGVGEGLDKRNDSVLTSVIGRDSVLAIVRRVKMCNCVLFPSWRPPSKIRWKTIVLFLRDLYSSGTVYQLCTSYVPFCLKHPMGRRSDLLWYGQFWTVAVVVWTVALAASY